MSNLIGQFITATFCCFLSFFSRKLCKNVIYAYVCMYVCMYSLEKACGEMINRPFLDRLADAFALKAHWMFAVSSACIVVII